MQEDFPTQPPIQTFDRQDLFSADKLKLIRCEFKKAGKLYCSSKKCNHYAVVCNEKQCKCFEKHQNCSFIKIQFLNVQFQSNAIYPLKKISGEIQIIFDKMIDALSEARDEILIRLKSYGFEAHQNQYVELINHKLEIQSHEELRKILKGKNICKVLETAQGKRGNILQKENKKIRDIFDKSLEKAKSEVDSLDTLLNSAVTKESSYFSESVILETKEDENFVIKSIREEVMKPIDKIICLLSATEPNRFKMNEILRDKLNLVYLIKKTNGFRYGLFSPRPVFIQLFNNANQKSEFHEVGINKTSFLFSLDNFEKSKPIKDKLEIFHGPWNETILHMGRKEDPSLIVSLNKNQPGYLSNSGSAFEPFECSFEDLNGHSKDGESMLERLQIFQVKFEGDVDLVVQQLANLIDLQGSSSSLQQSSSQQESEPQSGLLGSLDVNRIRNRNIHNNFDNSDSDF